MMRYLFFNFFHTERGFRTTATGNRHSSCAFVVIGNNLPSTGDGIRRRRFLKRVSTQVDSVIAFGAAFEGR
ncbi:hypothetical protein AKJ16_DCAP03351 [Drosera capensis]